MSERTVLDKATLLGQRLDRLAEHRTRADGTNWIPRQIENLRDALRVLRDQLELARKVNSLVGSEQIDLTNIDAGFGTFRKRSDDDSSYPSKTSWQAAVTTVKATASGITDQTHISWRTWARARLAELPTDRIKLIASEPRARAETELGDLRRMADARVVEIGHVNRFPLLLDGLRALLDDTPTMSADVVSALRLFHLLDTVTLHDLTDEHVAALRRSELDQRIELRWKDA